MARADTVAPARQKCPTFATSRLTFVLLKSLLYSLSPDLLYSLSPDLLYGDWDCGWRGGRGGREGGKEGRREGEEEGGRGLIGLGCVRIERVVKRKGGKERGENYRERMVDREGTEERGLGREGEEGKNSYVHRDLRW